MTTVKSAATREALGPTLIELQNSGEFDLIVVDADLGKSTSARTFQDTYPGRFFTFGIAEQNMISAAAGFSVMGHTVFATTFAVFAEHAFDQLRMMVAQPNLNVKIVASHGGVSPGEDGASAQSIEDFALFSSLLNFNVCVPADVIEAAAITKAAALTPGPFYIRTARPKTSIIYTNGPQFELGKANQLREGNDLTIIACGLMVERALTAADELKNNNINARVLNMSTLRPLDTNSLFAAATDTGALVIAEEHLSHTGLGAMCAHALASNVPVPIEFVGLDRYGESATWEEALELTGLTSEKIISASHQVLSRKIT
ncbi:MAG: transketolase [Chloroflexi bacterium]|nr:transketolase [Chloroflexota bacterium]|tara:strand:+ start:18799 stop:19746 length:948 start_codon:yes stop_codon:yes gene_type:complete